MVVAEVDNFVEISSCVNEVDDCGVVDDGCMVLCCSTILQNKMETLNNQQTVIMITFLNKIFNFEKQFKKMIEQTLPQYPQTSFHLHL